MIEPSPELQYQQDKLNTRAVTLDAAWLLVTKLLVAPGGCLTADMTSIEPAQPTAALLSFMPRHGARSWLACSILPPIPSCCMPE